MLERPTPNAESPLPKGDSGTCGLFVVRSAGIADDAAL